MYIDIRRDFADFCHLLHPNSTATALHNLFPVGLFLLLCCNEHLNNKWKFVIQIGLIGKWYSYGHILHTMDTNNANGNRTRTGTSIDLFEICRAHFFSHPTDRMSLLYLFHIKFHKICYRRVSRINWSLIWIKSAQKPIFRSNICQSFYHNLQSRRKQKN